MKKRLFVTEHVKQIPDIPSKSPLNRRGAKESRCLSKCYHRLGNPKLTGNIIDTNNFMLLLEAYGRGHGLYCQRPA